MSKLAENKKLDYWTLCGTSKSQPSVSPTAQESLQKKTKEECNSQTWCIISSKQCSLDKTEPLYTQTHELIVIIIAYTTWTKDKQSWVVDRFLKLYLYLTRHHWSRESLYSSEMWPLRDYIDSRRWPYTTGWQHWGDQVDFV